MHKALLLLSLLPFAAPAQTTWNVTVGGSTIGGTSPYYSPQNLTINVGDIVRWSNVSGTHNVNGNQSLFPGNPQSFSSGNAASGGWNYQFTFTLPGTYNYHCTQPGHSATQFGSITVVDPGTGIAGVEEAGAGVRVFPSPATDLLTIEAEGLTLRQVAIIGLNGEVVASAGVQQAGPVFLDVSGLPAANYFVLFTDADGRMTAKPFAKQ